MHQTRAILGQSSQILERHHLILGPQLSPYLFSHSMQFHLNTIKGRHFNHNIQTKKKILHSSSLSVYFPANQTESDLPPKMQLPVPKINPIKNQIKKKRTWIRPDCRDQCTRAGKSRSLDGGGRGCEFHGA